MYFSAMYRPVDITRLGGVKQGYRVGKASYINASVSRKL